MTFRIPEVELKSLGFKVQRKRFNIQVFHLPPEADVVGEAADASNLISGPKTSGCSASSSNPLDF